MPVTLLPIALRLLPWALVGLLALTLWGGYGHLKAATEARTHAEEERDAALAGKKAAEDKAKADQKLLAEREVERQRDQKNLAAQHKRIQELTHEGCLSLESGGHWLDDILLPDGSPLPTDSR